MSENFEYRFSRDDAVGTVLRDLTRDMRHVLSRVIFGLSLVACGTTLGAILDGFDRDWIGAGISSAIAAFLWLMVHDTWTRFRKYGGPR